MKIMDSAMGLILILMGSFSVFPGCTEISTGLHESRVNTSHLDNLFEEVVVSSGDSVGIIHIYCEYPDYQWVGDDDEGIACVDDATRAMVFYARHFKATKDPSAKDKARKLLKFLLTMQAENGYFYNFIWENGTINKTFKTSVARPDWWSWRVLWSYGEVLPILDPNDPITLRTKKSRELLVSTLIDDFTLQDSTQMADGFEVPTWLPNRFAADQAALILLGLTSIYQEAKDARIESLMDHLARGIMMMQVENNRIFPHGVFFSWKNLWHAYGNNQAYALLTASEVLDDSSMLHAALEEIHWFYPGILVKNGLNHFVASKDSLGVEITRETQFSQIAYGYRPMIWACMKAHSLTGNDKYKGQAERISTWFFGSNPANSVMYDQKTGRGYDGIISNTEINRNAGAESTIEALLSIQAMEVK